MSEARHQEIRAWRETWKNKPYSIIDYRLEFEKDPHTKKENELTFPEECYLISKYIESC
jgi:hypothetical protein